MKHTWLIICALFIGITLSGCESDEMDDIAKAQDCLDKASSTDALLCLKYVAKYDSQKANIIRCSAYFMGGGLTTQRIADAYKELVQNGSTDKEAIFIGALTLEVGSPNVPVDALALVESASLYCQKTGVKGLIYLSSLSVIGTSLSAAAGANGFTTLPPSQAEIDTTLATCQTTPATCNPDGIAAAAELISTSYCVGSNEDSDICTKINTALDAGGDAGEAIMCLIDNKTWNGVSCT